MSEAIHRATQVITYDHLPRMVLGHRDLPDDLQHFIPYHQEFLDNEKMAAEGLIGSSAERFRDIGRLTGYVQDFRAPKTEDGTIPPGYDVAVATVVHLFDAPQSVTRWIEEVFLHDFESHVDEEIHPGQHLLLAQRLSFTGFADEVAGLRVLQSTENGPVSSTGVDLRVGRVLGVAYIATFGNYNRQELVQELGLMLERKIVRVVLGDL
jgi:hypothetical protein